MDRLDQDQIKNLIEKSSPLDKVESQHNRSESLLSLLNISNVPVEPSKSGDLPKFAVKPLIKTLNRYFAFLKGLKITESDIPLFTYLSKEVSYSDSSEIEQDEEKTKV